MNSSTEQGGSEGRSEGGCQGGSKGGPQGGGSQCGGSQCGGSQGGCKDVDEENVSVLLCKIYASFSFCVGWDLKWV